MSNAEQMFLTLYLSIASDRLGIPTDDVPAPRREYRFDPERKWRADFAWPEQRIIVEIEGGQWTGGRHNRAGGYANDCEKYNAATAQGWRVFRFTPQMLRTQIGQIESVIELIIEVR